MTQPRASSHATDPSVWVDRHADAMYRYAILRVQNGELAEELVQEALVGALAARRDFAQKSAERTWLIGILKNKIVDHFRSQSSRRAALEAAENDPAVRQIFTDDGFWHIAPQRWKGSPHRALEDKEFKAVLYRCIEKLPRSVADAFCLRELEQLSGEHVCQILGITPAAFWTQMYRARMRLRRCLELNWFRADETTAGENKRE